MTAPVPPTTAEQVRAEMPPARPRKPQWLYQGVRPRWVRLRTWERIFEDGYRAALEDVARAEAVTGEGEP